MAVSENDLVVGPLTPAAGVTTISLDFFFEQASWLEVYKSGSETPLVLNTDYTVAGAGTSSGVVTLTTAANGTDAYAVYLAVPLERSSDMQLRGEFKSEPFNIEMDRVWQRLQFHWTHIMRSLRISATSTAATILNSVGAGQYVRLNDDGTGFVGVDGQISVSEITAFFQARNSASASQAALLNDGSLVVINGLLYRVDSTATGSASATNDLGVSGLVAEPDAAGFVSDRHYGVVRDLVTTVGIPAYVSGTDNAAAFTALFTNHEKIRLSDGGAYCSVPINVDGGHVVVGTGRSCIIHFPNTANRWFEIGANTQFTGVLQDFRIQCDDHSAVNDNSGFAWISAAQCQAVRIEAREFRYPHFVAPGTGQSVAYNEFHHISAVGGLRNIYRNASGTGWVNQNKFFGGRAFTRSHTEYNVHWDDGTGNGGSENAFLHMSLEGAGLAAAYLGGAGNLIMDCRTEGTWTTDDIVLSANSQRCLVVNHTFYTTVTDNGQGNSIITSNGGSKFSSVLNGVTPLTLDYNGATDQSNLDIKSSRDNGTSFSWRGIRRSDGLVRSHMTTDGRLYAARNVYIGQSGYAFEPIRMGNVWVWWDGDYLRVKETSAPTSATDGAIIQPVQTSVAAGLGNAANIVNTVGKFEGKQVFDTGLNQPVWATGSSATATWVYADGTTAYTPS